jgi:acetyl-CoA carboxylase carboxyltransferase component
VSEATEPTLGDSAGATAGARPEAAFAELDRRVRRGGAERYHVKAREQGKLFVRERLRRLLDGPGGTAEGGAAPRHGEGLLTEDGLLANALAGDLPADGVVTGVGRIGGRPVAVVANDSTVKAGSWGARTVEKILRLEEYALAHEVPLVWLIDSAGARITDQVEMFPGRRGAGRIFANQVKLSGKVPQVCCLFGPSAAGGAYIPAFCDVVFMVDGNASMYLGSPRMAEMVIGERTTLEEMGGAAMHCRVSGCGDLLCADEDEAIRAARAYLSYFPRSWREQPPAEPARGPAYAGPVAPLVPTDEAQPFDMYPLVAAVVDEGSLFEIKREFAPELITALARIEGRAVGIVANQPLSKGGVLFVDSADKAARFIWLCDAFNLPLVFLADVPGFMIGRDVERQGIIRHGAKMITAVTEATVPKICVVVRKAYGAGLYAMAGPGFWPDATIALPTASIAVMGPEAAVNAVYYNRLAALPEAERAAEAARLRAEYRQDVDLSRLAADLVIDAVVDPEELRAEIAARLTAAEGKDRHFTERRHGVPPV